MRKIKVSICLIAWDRREQLQKSLEKNIWNSRVDGNRIECEFLFADQGSKDPLVVKVLKRYGPKYLRENTENEGVARAFNQLMLRADGDYVCLLGNDINMPRNWLGEMIKYAEAVGDKCGLIGVQCTAAMPPCIHKHGVNAHFVNETIDKVFGTWIIPRKVIDTIGYFDENFHPYGLEDSDYNNRVTRAGFDSFYVPTMKSEHIGHDVGDQTEYRKMKDESLSRGLAHLQSKMENYSPDNLKIESEMKFPI